MNLSLHPMHLVTTAIKATRSQSAPMVFLGPWCEPYTRDQRHVEILPSPWADSSRLASAHREITALRERILPGLVAGLNHLHGTSHEERYWRILVGPWLLIFVAVLYDRYQAIKAALDRYPELTTIGLANESMIIPRDTLEFALLLKDDPYNLQIFTDMFTGLGHDLVRISVNIPRPTFFVSTPSLSAKSLARQALSRFFQLIGRSPWSRHMVFVKEAYFPRTTELALTIKTGGRILPDMTPDLSTPDVAPDQESRAGLGSFLPTGQPVETVLTQMLPRYLPTCFVESYNLIRTRALKIFPRNSAAVITAGWYFNEFFKTWMAARMEKGTILAGIQHGGNYGSLAQMVNEDHETTVSDRYFTWGWSRTGCPAEVIPTPAPKLIRGKPARLNPNAHILLVTTVHPRYLVQFPYVPAYFVEYLDWQKRFLSSIDPSLRSRLRVRPHREDQGWQISQRIQDCFPWAAIETWDIPFSQSLECARLYVSDHLSTTFVEALAANKPTLLFWNPDWNQLRPEAWPIFQGIVDAGILHYHPESAGATLNQIYNQCEDWWLASERQTARGEFCARFGRTSTQALDEWTAIMTDLVNGQKARPRMVPKSL